MDPAGVPTALSPTGVTVPVPSPLPCVRFTFLDARRVGRNVHLRFRLAHREQGNFLSHFVFVLAQLLQAIGVRPADFGIMGLGGKPSWLFASLPWTV